MMPAEGKRIGARERAAFALLALLAFAYVALRAALVPWVNDEALTFQLYAEPGEFLPFRAPWDANNHFLNSAMMTAALDAFGLTHLGSRLGNVLAYLIYAWAAYRIGERVQGRFVRWCLWSALLLCPMLIELFSLARGYGMAAAFWLEACVWLMRLAAGWRLRALIAALLLALLANASVPVAVPVWAAVLAVLLPAWLRHARGSLRWAGLAAWLILGAAPLALAVRYGMELRRLGGIVIGGPEGLLPVTVATLMEQLTGSGAPAVAWTAALLIALAAVALAIRRWREPALLIPAALLGADALSRWAMAGLLQVNYPIDRAVAHLVPWAIATIAFAADALAGRWPRWAYAAALLLGLPARTLAKANLHGTALWSYQSPPERLVRSLAQELKGGAAIVGVPPHMGLSIALEARRLGLEAPHSEADDPESPWSELRIVLGREAAERAPGFRLVDSVPATGHYLLKREAPVRLVTDLEVERAAAEGEAEYIELINTDTLMDGTDRVIDIEGPIDSGGRYLGLVLCVSMQGSDGSDIYYAPYSVSLLRPRWRGERLRVRLPVPAVPGAVNRKIYLWNVHKRPWRAGPFRAALRRLEG